MAEYIREEPATVERRYVEPASEHVHVDGPRDTLTSYAAVKYGFILVMTIVVLYFLARFVIPLVR